MDFFIARYKIINKKRGKFMKKRLPILLLIPSLFAVSGCDAFLGGGSLTDLLDPLYIFHQEPKVPEEENENLSLAELIDPLHIIWTKDNEEQGGNQGNNNNQGNTTGGSTTGGNTTGGGQTTGQETGTLLDILKGKAKSIVAKVLNKAESAVVFADYEGDSSNADVYYYDSSSLTFVDVEVYYESFNTSLADTLKGYLPSGVTLSSNDDYLDLLEEYGAAWYDRTYTDGTYAYNIYVEAYDEMSDDEESYPAETYGCIFIYKASQQSAFEQYMSVDE